MARFCVAFPMFFLFTGFSGEIPAVLLFLPEHVGNIDRFAGVVGACYLDSVLLLGFGRCSGFRCLTANRYKRLCMVSKISDI